MRPSYLNFGLFQSLPELLLKINFSLKVLGKPKQHPNSLEERVKQYYSYKGLFFWCSVFKLKTVELNKFLLRSESQTITSP